jgi:predicted transposase YbfD/YdcC
MQIKGNSKTLHEKAKRRLDFKESRAETIGTRGYDEITRTIYRAKLNGMFKSWLHASEVWKVVNTTRNIQTNAEREETRYFATSIPSARLSSSQCLAAVRCHWRIENNAFWTMDAVLEEDSRPFAANALEIISLVRVIAFNLLARFRGSRLRNKQNRVLRWKDFQLAFFALFMKMESAPLYNTS